MLKTIIKHIRTFGSDPWGDRLKRLAQSPNYKNGYFYNIHPTPMWENASTLWMLSYFIVTTHQKNLVPQKKVPFIKSDLMNADCATPKITWFGHSSYLIQYRGKNILVDPVFCGHASPMWPLVRAFSGSNEYKVSDLPHIDLLVITHDHYDHLDYSTIMDLRKKTAKYVVPLGVGAHLEGWRIATEKIIELDWWEKFEFDSEVKITATPARHFSGRGIIVQKTFWASYMLELDEFKIFIGGDSGYDDQFKKIGDTFGSVDMALLECGQYGVNWPYTHMFPEQTAQAAKDLNAKYLFPVHWGKFALARHGWDESIERLIKKAEELNIPITTPLIGESIMLNHALPNTAWWKIKS